MKLLFEILYLPNHFLPINFSENNFTKQVLRILKIENKNETKQTCKAKLDSPFAPSNSSIVTHMSSTLITEYNGQD